MESAVPEAGGDLNNPPAVSPFPNWEDDSEEMVGSRVRVYWDGDNEWYSGRIVRFNADRPKPFLVRCVVRPALGTVYRAPCTVCRAPCIVCVDGRRCFLGMHAGVGPKESPHNRGKWREKRLMYRRRLALGVRACYVECAALHRTAYQHSALSPGSMALPRVAA